MAYKRLLAYILLRCKRILLVTSLLLNAGLMLYLYRLFLLAYASPEKAVCLYINLKGEAFNELFLMTGAAILGIAGAIAALRIIRKTIVPKHRKKEEEKP